MSPQFFQLSEDGVRAYVHDRLRTSRVLHIDAMLPTKGHEGKSGLRSTSFKLQ